MNIQKTITVGIIAAAASAMALDYCEVTGVNARQRYPWNGLVDIDFTLDSKATEPYLMNVTVFDNVGKTNLPVKTVYTEGISFKENPCMVHKDTSRILWDAAADLPDGFKCTNVLVTCQDTRSMGTSNLYMIVDLSGGTAAEKFTVTYTNCPPKGGWTEDYKLTKLVLRRVEPHVFQMGSPLSEDEHASNESLHNVELTKPYYIGVFEVSESQYALICGGSGGDTKPVEKTWDAIRGWDVENSVTTTLSDAFVAPYQGTFTVIQNKTASGYAWPNSSNVGLNSFMGNLRAKTSLMFDLPTEAQWECACRAGSATPLNVGEDNTESASALIRGEKVLDPTETHYIYIGNFMPNALGLYDMLGNVDEWCLDVYENDLGKEDRVDPVGPSITYIEKVLMNKVPVKGGEGPWSVSFGGKTLSVPSKWSVSCDATYKAYGVNHVVRGGQRSAYRSSDLVVNTSGAIFTTGVGGKKASYSNKVHGIRVALTVDE